MGLTDDQLNEMLTKVAVIEERTKNLDKKFVSTDEFRPVKAICYGFVTTFCFAVIAAMLVAVIK